MHLSYIIIYIVRIITLIIFHQFDNAFISLYTHTHTHTHIYIVFHGRWQFILTMVRRIRCGPAAAVRCNKTVADARRTERTNPLNSCHGTVNRRRRGSNTDQSCDDGIR